MNAKRCEICGQAAQVHVTDMALDPPSDTHFCGSHVPDEFSRTLREETARIWRNPDSQRSIAEFFSRETNVPPAEARTEIERHLNRLSDRDR